MSQKTIDKANALRDSGKTREAESILIPLLNSKDYQVAVNAHCALGICFSNEKKYGQAISMYKKAIDICEANKWVKRIGGISRDLGIAYKNAKEFDEAEKWLKVSLELIKRYYDEGQGIDSSLGIGYSKLGLTYTGAKQFVKAKKAFDTGINLLRKSNHDYWKLIGAIDRCYFYLATKKYKQASLELPAIISSAIEQEKEYKLVEAFILAGDAEKGLKNTNGAKMFYSMAKITVTKIFDAKEVRDKFIKEIEEKLKK
jgi:tetratricopeptide (TPR) repeat protein